MGEVQQSLAWVDTMLMTPQSGRERWVETILRGVESNAAAHVFPECQGKGSAKALANAKKQLRALVKMVRSDEFEVMGFAPNVQYLRVKGSKTFLESWWVHPFSSPTLVAKHRSLPVVMLIGPSLQKDRSSIYEVEGGQILMNPVEGYTG
jgi:hypothetical protein